MQLNLAYRWFCKLSVEDKIPDHSVFTRTNRACAKPRHLALVIRMDQANATIQDYFLLPAAELAKTKVKRLRLTSRVFAKAYRHDSLDAFYRICVPAAGGHERGNCGGMKAQRRPSGV